MVFSLTRRKLAPVATILMALVLTGCVAEGGYYEGDRGRDYRRDSGRIHPPPRHVRPDYDYRRDRDWRRPPPRRDYDRQPPSIYDDRGYGERDRRYGDRRPDYRDPRLPYPVRN